MSFENGKSTEDSTKLLDHFLFCKVSSFPQHIADKYIELPYVQGDQAHQLIKIEGG
jgi:hypothetical protein